MSLLSVKLPVCVPQPAERWFVFTGQPMMEIDQSVVTFNILIQGSFKIPVKNKTNALSFKEIIVYLNWAPYSGPGLTMEHIFTNLLRLSAH